jgi:hypothetical protein
LPQFSGTKKGGVSVAEAFTSLSIITIASAPLTHILVSMISLFGAIGCFTRLQEFLQLEEQHNSREVLSDVLGQPATDTSTAIQSDTEPKAPFSDIDTELASFPQNFSRGTAGNDTAPIITIENTSVA